MQQDGAPRPRGSRRGRRMRRRRPTDGTRRSGTPAAPRTAEAQTHQEEHQTQDGAPLEIPGFLYDAATGRYFRIPPHAPAMEMPGLPLPAHEAHEAGLPGAPRCADDTAGGARSTVPLRVPQSVLRRVLTAQVHGGNYTALVGRDAAARLHITHASRECGGDAGLVLAGHGRTVVACDSTGTLSGVDVHSGHVRWCASTGEHWSSFALDSHGTEFIGSCSSSGGDSDGSLDDEGTRTRVVCGALDSRGTAGGGLVRVYEWRNHHHVQTRMPTNLWDAGLARRSVWSVRWAAGNRVLAGTSRGVVVFPLGRGAGSGSLLRRTKTASDVIAVSAVRAVPHTVLCGVRSGVAEQLDLRVRRASVLQWTLKGGGSCDVQCVDDEAQHVMTSSVGGQLAMWDVRQVRAPVLTLAGHANARTELPLRMAIDAGRALLASGGSLTENVNSPSVLRVWSLRTGELLLCEKTERTVRAGAWGNELDEASELWTATSQGVTHWTC